MDEDDIARFLLSLMGGVQAGVEDAYINVFDKAIVNDDQ
jgi:hypothetical protein